MLSRFLQYMQTDKGSLNMSARSHAQSPTDSNPHREPVPQSGEGELSGSTGARPSRQQRAHREKRVCGQTEEFAHLRQEMKISSGRGACPPDGAPQNCEFRGGKHLSGKQLAQVLNAAVYDAYVKGAFDREGESISTS